MTECVSYSRFDFDILPRSQPSWLHTYYIPTQGSVPLLQELHLDNLIDRWSILQFIYESHHQVLVVAREDAQMVSGFVAQPVVVVCVEPHNYGGTTAKAIRDLRNNAGPFSIRSI